MGEETDNGNPIPDWTGSDSAYGISQERVLDWETGLPGSEELIPLTQTLISSELASAFSIKLDQSPYLLGIPGSSSQHTSSSLLRHAPSSRNHPLPLTDEYVAAERPAEDDKEAAEDDMGADVSAPRTGYSCEGGTAKRPRLVWTPHLHERFVEVVAHLGDKAVPKAIMQLMNVEGLTRENVASHLQKYRLYQKRTHGISDEGTSSSLSGHLFIQATDPTFMQELPSLSSFQGPQLIPLPVFGFPHHQWYKNPSDIMDSHHTHGRSIEQEDRM